MAKPGPPKGCPPTPGAGRPKGALNKSTRAIKEIAQPYGPEAIETYVELMRSKNPSEADRTRLAAATCLLDRGYGRPVQQVEQKVDGAPSFVVALPPVAADHDAWLAQVTKDEAEAKQTRN